MKWRVGTHRSTVVTDEPVKYNVHKNMRPNAEEGDREYYGGYLVAESILNEDNVRLIAAAPEMYDIIKRFTLIRNEEQFNECLDDAKRIVSEIEYGKN